MCSSWTALSSTFVWCNFLTSWYEESIASRLYEFMTYVAIIGHIIRMLWSITFRFIQLNVLFKIASLSSSLNIELRFLSKGIIVCMLRRVLVIHHFHSICLNITSFHECYCTTKISTITFIYKCFVILKLFSKSVTIILLPSF